MALVLTTCAALKDGNMKIKVEERIIAPKEVIVGDPDAKVLIVEYGDYESAETAKINDVVLRTARHL